MSESRSLRALRRTLYVVGVVPIVAGAATVILGSESIPAAGDPNANLESELRFYSVWWIGAGLFVIWLAPRVAERTRELRVFCALLFLAAVSRLFAVLDTDWPSTGQIVLMGVEFALAVIFPVWQARALRRSA
jgi:hypothetical protein